MLSSRKHELLSVTLLGIGVALLFLGWVTQTFLSESVIHSIHKTNPDAISEYAGYYGSAIQCLAFAIGSLFTASLHHFISAKTSLIISSVLFSFFYLGFFHVNSLFFYFSQFLMGIGNAIYNNAEGTYLAEHSSEKTLISNTGIETGVGHTSMLNAGVIFIIINHFFANSSSESTTYREFSLSFIQITYSFLFGITVISGVVFSLLPSKQQPDSVASKSTKSETSLKQHFKMLLTTSFHQNVLLLVITTFHQGFFCSFYQGIYPTSLSFTSSLKNDVYLIGLYSLFLGIAQLSGFLILRPLMQKYPKHKLVVTMAAHVVVLFLSMAVVIASVPNEATRRPDNVEQLLLQPSRWVICLVGFLLGLADYTITMARAVICQLAVPEARAQVFSLTRVFQSMASCVVLFLSPYFTLRIWMLILGVGGVVGSVAFTVVARRTSHMVRPVMKTNVEEDREGEKDCMEKI